MEAYLDGFPKSDLAPISIDWDYRSTSRMVRVTETPVTRDSKYI